MRYRHREDKSPGKPSRDGCQIRAGVKKIINREVNLGGEGVKRFKNLPYISGIELRRPARALLRTLQY